MKAIAAARYGSLDALGPIDAPVPDPKAGQVRVRVHASALNPADYKVVLGTMKFLHGRRFPLVVGYDFSGVVDAAGEGAGFVAGDEVYGFLPYSPMNNRGAFAELLVADAREIAKKPAGVTHATAAAAATPGLTALQMLRDLGRLGANGRVLVTGVSGGVGSLAIGIARRLGGEVTAIGSGAGLDLARERGAQAVIDRKAVDPLAAASGPFDVICDAAAGYRWKTWKTKLAPGGTYVTTLPSAAFFADKIASLFSRTRCAFVNVKSRAEDLEQLGAWLADGLAVAVERVVPVRELAPALASLRDGRVVGRIAVDVATGF